MTKEEIWIRWEQVLNCWNGRYPDTIGRYLDTKNSIRMPKEGIRICWGSGIRMLKEASEYAEGHPDTRERYPDTQLKLENSDETATKTQKNYFNL